MFHIHHYLLTYNIFLNEEEAFAQVAVYSMQHAKYYSQTFHVAAAFNPWRILVLSAIKGLTLGL